VKQREKGSGEEGDFNRLRAYDVITKVAPVIAHSEAATRELEILAVEDDGVARRGQYRDTLLREQHSLRRQVEDAAARTREVLEAQKRDWSGRPVATPLTSTGS
jgi:hypothetical protein